MSRFVDRQVERFWLPGEPGPDGVSGPSEDWVDLLVRLPYAARAAIEQKLIGPALAQAPARTEGPAPELSGDAKEAARLSGDAMPAAVNTEVAIAAGNAELLKRAIVAWGGPGFTLSDGKVAPINEQTIAILDDTAERILGELQRRMVKPKPDFTPPSSPPTSTAGAEANTEAS